MTAFVKAGKSWCPAGEMRFVQPILGQTAGIPAAYRVRWLDPTEILSILFGNSRAALTIVLANAYKRNAELTLAPKSIWVSYCSQTGGEDAAAKL